ncbi:universal stress protein [Natrononativus amylolyticus]|uniref:universal stress protein n=1 Tax=Natrononativus amylolyticus TaxID=2963434 RepID=UPI0020CDA670|nr:universal stress protein [Natrononativus amylolyticus]
MPDARLLVPVANPETTDRLLDTAIDVARDRDLEILVLTVIAVPPQLALEHARANFDVDDAEGVVHDAVERAQAAGVAATGRVRFGRGVATGIVNVAESEDVETILLGWRGRPRRREIVLGSYIDEVLSEAPCDVLVKRIDRDPGPISSVLVPVAGGPNTEYAAAVAGALARAYDAEIELLTVVSDADEETIADARTLLTETSTALGAVSSVTETVLEGSVVETVLERTADHDVTILGAAESGLIRRALVGDVPEAIARDASGAVLMAKRHQPTTSRLWRLLRRR